jgi:hypothetical protein
MLRHASASLSGALPENSIVDVQGPDFDDLKISEK